MTISIADLRAAGIRFESNEAVAIAQQLISSLQDRNEPDQAQPPYGPPSAANVFLNADGSVVCRGCTTTSTVSEIGIFLDELLTTGSPRVPGAVRYTVARALLNVDVPPFDSLAEFSSDLARHERDERADVVRRLLARAGIAATIVPPTAVERRLSASATALRRELRHADARLFQQREGAHAKPSVIDLIAMAPLPAPPARRRTLSAATACLAAGVSLIASGEFIQSRQAPLAVSHTASIAAPASIARAKPQPDLARGIIVVREPSARPVRAARPEVRRVSVKRTGSSAAPRRTSAGSRSHSRNLLDRLKLGWLRTRIVIRHDL